MSDTKPQLKRFRTLLSVLKLWNEKETLVLEVSQGRTVSSSELSLDEIKQLNKFLQQKADAINGQVPDPRGPMIKKIYSICHDLGWEDKQGNVDKERMNAYLLKYGYLHKDLNAYQYNELPTLVTQFENLQRSKYAKS